MQKLKIEINIKNILEIVCKIIYNEYNKRGIEICLNSKKCESQPYLRLING